MDNRNVRRLLLILSLCVYFTSLGFEAVPGAKGLTVLFMGWMEFFAIETVGPFVALAWLANPLVLLGLQLDSFPLQPFGYMARVFFAIALVLSIGYIVFGEFIVTDESGSASTSVLWTTGYIFWLGSIVAASLRALWPKPTENQDLS